MSCPTEIDKIENLEFRWGKKRGVGGKRREVQFYESFTYDGLDYCLHDCVYMYKEGEPEPYIGKLIKIWENADKSRKVKVQWFFRPSEILNWLQDEHALENEIFLASGEGRGLANVNPLEAIAGKCNVICISKDIRNPQPSEEELKMADHIFYRTFDVGQCTISDKMDEKVGGLEIKFIFNRKEGQNASNVLKLASESKHHSNAAECDQSLQLSSNSLAQDVKTLATDGNVDHLVAKDGAAEKDLLVKQGSSGGKSDSAAVQVLCGVDFTTVQSESVSGNQLSCCKENPHKDEVKVSKDPSNIVEVERIKSVKDVVDGLDNRPPKKPSIDNVVKDFTRTTAEENTLSKKSRDIFGSKNGVKSSRESSALDDRPFKKVKAENFGKSDEDTKVNVQRPNINSYGIDAKNSAANAASCEEKVNSTIAKDFARLDKGLVYKDFLGDKKKKLFNDKLSKKPERDFAEEDKKVESREFEVTRRPNADKSKWFRALPWEERMQSAHEQGTLVLLQNLDPEYCSGEVEDIIWHALKENCTAKMMPGSALSSPHSGQAFVIFKTKEAAERAIRKLDQGCLMLPNGRPLIGSIGPPPGSAGKQSVYFGHLSIDKIRIQMQREMKDAVSTSHYSQPNTIEYEMAMEWCLLQARSDSWWEGLSKKQGEELRKVKAKLKAK